MMTFCVVVREIFKPPQLVFFFTIISLAVILLAFSISVHIKKDKIIDPYSQSWNSFNGALSSLGVCLLPREKSKFVQKEKEILQHKSGGINITTVSFLTDVPQFVIDDNEQNNYYVHAVIRAMDIGFPNSKNKNDFVELTISNRKLKKSKGLSCVTVLGPSKFLSRIKPKSLHECIQPEKRPKDELLFMQKERTRMPEFCPSGHFGYLVIGMKEDLKEYVSQEDMRLIHMHIYVTSSILCVLILITFIYSVIGKFLKNEKKLGSDLEMVTSETLAL